MDSQGYEKCDGLPFATSETDDFAVQSNSHLKFITMIEFILVVDSNASTILTKGIEDGEVVTLEKVGFAQVKGKADATPTPIIITDNGKWMYVRSLRRRYVDTDGNFLQPQGSFVDAWNKHLQSCQGKNDKEILESFLTSNKGKKVRCSYRYYRGYSQKNQMIVKACLDFDWAD